MEGYVLYRHDRPISALTALLKNDIVSPGIYVTGVPVDGLKYTGELTFQGGKQQDQSFFAYAVFIPNQGAQNLGHDIATHWAYAMITLRTP